MSRPNFIAAQFLAAKPRSASSLRLLPLFASVSITVAASGSADAAPAKLTNAKAGSSQTVVSQSRRAKVGVIRIAANNTISTPKVTLPTDSHDSLVVSINSNAKMVAEKVDRAKESILSREEAKEVAPSTGKVILAQLAAGEGDTGPAATPPSDTPGGLSVPLGKEEPNVAVPAAPPAKEPEAPAPATTETPEAPPITTTNPALAPILGDTRAAAGREITEVRIGGNRDIPLATIPRQIRNDRG